MAADTLLVIDGNSLAHRAFHAIPLLSTTQGVVTNAVYGFTNMLLKVLAEYPAQFVAVCFDKGKITFRHDDYEQYKATRKATPDELRTQFPLIKELLAAMRIPVLEGDGFEADDLIGTLVNKATEAKIASVIVTGDQDALQLVSPLTRVLLTRKGITELEEYTEGKVWDRFGVTPAQFADFKGLVGDQSDNIPGVPGIGAKTAAALLKDYRSLENLIDRAGELPERYREKIRQFAGQAFLSKRLATIRQDAPLAVNLRECRWQGPDHQELLNFFSKVEFKSLLRSFLQPEKARAERKKPKPPPSPERDRDRDQKRDRVALFDLDEAAIYQVDFQEITGPEELTRLVAALRRAGRTALACAGDRKKGVRAVALAFPDGAAAGGAGTGGAGPGGADPGGAGPKGGADLFRASPAGESPHASLRIVYFPVETSAQATALRDICADPDVAKLVHHGKEILWQLKPHETDLNNLAGDTMIGAYLLNPGSSNLDLPALALKHLNLALPENGPAALSARADAVYRLAGALAGKLRLQEADRLFCEVEMPLIKVLAQMEMAGVVLDVDRLNAMSVELGQRIQDLAGEIYRLAGEEFNINSTRQLGFILFEKLQLPVVKRTKTGYSTDVEVLEELAGAHPVVAKILAHRQLVKLKSTYTDGLAALIDPYTGRVHTTFHQTVTATGRLSSSEPNLQNIPVRLEEGRKIRQVFIPRQKENLILSADYSQIELRILAHVTGDPGLVEAFATGQDIHTRTAAEVFGVAAAEVTADLRGRAKAVNFGIVYGQSDFGLARSISVSRQEAREYIENYFLRYKGVKEYIERTKTGAREKGYVTTILNRRRYLPELFSPSRTLRSFGERAAVNMPIQGSAADIIKLAMLRVHEELAKRRLETKMILQVHDELIFDVPRRELEEVAGLVRSCMENAVALKVPLIVDLKAGPNWYETKPLK